MSNSTKPKAAVAKSKLPKAVSEAEAKAAAEQKAVDDALARLATVQPAGGKRVDWTDAQIRVLTAFIKSARFQGISLNTMYNNFADMVSPIFPDKSRSAFWTKAGEIYRELYPKNPAPVAPVLTGTEQA